ncbi:bifunctional phosphopantothenoylcysteine decarboxylase/phosphopantothenate--cysteine ligase CoaBC [Microbacterium sp. zg.Y625]|uniref:bifunctional phosphopantothenoylcysteine decarboxylase/phosphopantothenate--cysteine ligase CoaBC n=1 Tax=Microbacterium jiangjiandongii TaxID=3049071 RepID=UPI00214D03E2|nr:MULTISPECIES: bifunctional phosphopantothenoylcysteine decarboxylase/phosphopantothenate--cysteine ligase CoaBC [unclassified Microbacterium]MCR2794043.1 bifunctional phosphopantothenoylcysteine decarboxylase/phosphopantothenate--cysteine ligase CoaBC [Microbacterium sp. zg.Y625]WIM25749.1 bifunctional phosphopantothenoylcysteine decarboxylase/phosphopantothenate--cysteine ligase CoaBC [Microbacterium sp. zg-Y625]
MFVVVGVTGGIAAYKSVHLVRLLVLDGHDVHVLPTDAALRFVGRPTWEALSRNPVTTSLHDNVAQVRHVALGQRADLIIIAPATAHTLAKMAAGLADDLLGTTLLVTRAPVVVAPAMHTEMWQHPATRHSIAVLRERGVHVVGPGSGALTGTDAGEGRMSEPDEIFASAMAVLQAHADLAGLRVVVSAGGTREPLDPVRFLGNRSSGRQGVELALAAVARGADVTLVTAHVDGDALSPASADPRIRIRAVGTARELQHAMDDESEGADVLVMAAAVADYRPSQVATAKLTKEDGDGTLTLRLVENPDVVAGLAARRREGQTVVAFAAETGSDAAERLERARRKRERKGADLLVLNEVGWEQGFEATSNAVVIVGENGDIVGEAAGTKRMTADAVWDAVVALRRDPGSQPG